MGTTDDLMTASAPESGGWRFDDNVTASFEDMLERSIPQYRVMRETVAGTAEWVADRWTAEYAGTPPRIVDLGTSRGSALASVIDRVGNRADYFGYEISEPMIDVARERFEDRLENPHGRGRVTISRWDLRDGYPPVPMPATVVLSVLTVQFIPIEHRQRLLHEVYRNLAPRGAFIWVEKVLGATATLDGLEVDMYYGMKRGNGYTQEAIDRKRLALEGVLVPLTARFNEDLLRQAGFWEVDVLWRWSNFCAWVALKR